MLDENKDNEDNTLNGLMGVIESQRITNEVILTKLMASLDLLNQSLEHIDNDKLRNEIRLFISKNIN